MLTPGEMAALPSNETLDDETELVVLVGASTRARLAKTTAQRLATLIGSLGGGGSGTVQMVVYPEGGPWGARPEGAQHVIWVSTDPTAPTPTDLDDELDLLIMPQVDAWIIPISDAGTEIESGTKKIVTFAPYAMTLVDVPYLDFDVGPTGTAATIDINVDDSTILSTKLTVDAGETSSSSAATAAVYSTTAIAARAKITIDVDSIGTGASGGVVTVLHYAP